MNAFDHVERGFGGIHPGRDQETIEKRLDRIEAKLNRLVQFLDQLETSFERAIADAIRNAQN